MKMKDKNAEQLADRKKHRELKRAERRAETNLERREPVFIENKTILIVCEGENTEPSYFKQFKIASTIIKPIGEGFNTLSLVKRAIVLAEKIPCDKVWCVFDKDDFKNADFNDAIHLAEKKGFGVAYSNQAFEYWIILHFEDHQGGSMHRNEYYERINKILKPYNIVYNKDSKIITEDIFGLLEEIDEKTGKERYKLAIDRAKRNYNQLYHANPAIEESSTTVFKLISELRNYPEVDNNTLPLVRI